MHVKLYKKNKVDLSDHDQVVYHALLLGKYSHNERYMPVFSV